MRGTAALDREFVPGSGLLAAFKSADFGQLEEKLRDRIQLEKFRSATEKDRAELRDATAWLANHADQPAPENVDPDALAEFARKAEEKEREAATHFDLVIAALKGALSPPHNKFESDVQQLLRDGIEMLEGWLALYHGLSEMLARQVAKRSDPGAVLHALPVAADIAHGALSREFMARFPKIRAALAK